MHRLIIPGLTIALALTSTGCSNGVSNGAYDLGATPGGVQDIGYVRDIVADGYVPTSDQMAIAGLLNEHSMPLESTSCDELLCIKGAAGEGRVVATDDSALFLQIGYDSNLTTETFQREPVNLAIVVDTSGSMSGNLEGVKDALHTMIDLLDEGDRFSLTEFGSRGNVMQASRDVSDDNRNQLHNAVDRLQTNGSTNMEEGMTLGFDQMRPHVEEGVESRMMLFTDYQPNVGADTASEFETMVSEAADEGMHLSIFGIGATFGAGLAYEVSEQRGANFFFLRDGEFASSIFDEDFDFMVTPLAFDLNITVNAPFQYRDGFNIQGADPGDGTTNVSVEVATIFLSRSSGASVLTMELPEGRNGVIGEELALLSISYEDADGTAVNKGESILFGAAAGGIGDDRFSQQGTRKAAALVNMGIGMMELMDDFHDDNDATDSAAMFFEVRDRLEAEASEMEDDELQVEVELLDALAANAGIERPTDGETESTDGE